MALFDLQCGARDEPICGLRWEWECHVKELDIVTFIVPPEWVKGQRGKKTARVIVCNSVAREVIESVRGQHPVNVFTYQRGSRPAHPVTTMNNTSWQNWRASSGLGDLHVHDLRHTVGLRLREAGVPLETIGDILWHKNKAITAHYAGSMLQELYGAVEKITTEPEGFNKSLATIAREARAR